MNIFEGVDEESEKIFHYSLEQVRLKEEGMEYKAFRYRIGEYLKSDNDCKQYFGYMTFENLAYNIWRILRKNSLIGGSKNGKRKITKNGIECIVTRNISLNTIIFQLV